MKKTVLFAWLSAAVAMSADLPHIGYVYPAGGTPGSSFTVTIGGQHLKDTLGIHVSGAKVSADVTGFTYETDPRAANRLKNAMEKMKAALDEETDRTRREQIEYQIRQAEEEMAMVRKMRMEMRKDREAAARKQFNPQLADTVTLQVTIDADVEPGTRELRLITTNGLSNHLMFEVSELSEVQETEPNNEFADTVGQVSQLPLTMNGQIMPGDADCFRFEAGRGDTLVFRVQARSLVPYLADAVPGWFQAVLTLYNAEGREVAYVDDFRFDPDPVMVYQVPADGEYVLEIRDSIYRGRRDFVYRITAGELPFIDHIFPLGGKESSEVAVQLFGVNLPQKQLALKTAGDAPAVQQITVGRGIRRSNSRPFSVNTLPEAVEKEPNNLPSGAQAVESPVVVNGRIEAPGDVDCYRFKGRRGEVVSVEVLARRLDSPLDARLVLLDPGEHVVAVRDDAVDRGAGLVTHHADPLLQCELPETGEYTLRLDDLQGKGGHEYAYRLHIGRPEPDFELRVVPSSLSIPQDGAAVVTVHVLRKAGFDGSIELDIRNDPDGLELRRTVIPEGCDQVQVALTASDREPDELMILEIEGKARIGSRTVRRPAVPAEDMMQAFLYRHLVSAKELLVRVTEPHPASVVLDLPSDGLLEVRPGSQFEIPVRVTARPDVSGNVLMELSDPPEWIRLKSKGVGVRTERDQVLTFVVSKDAVPGDFANLLLNGSMSIAKSEDDPDYNPLLTMKWANRQKYDFTVGAISVMVKD